MIRKISFFCLFATSICCAHQKLPQFIDFGSEEFRDNFYQETVSPDFEHYAPLNGAWELGSFFTFLKNEYNLQTVVETGTFKGNTTSFFASVFNTVHTVEISHDFFQESVHNLRSFSNVVCHEGSSPVILRKILPSLSHQPVIFYLDAHWYEDWPLLDELKEISKTHKDNCVIIIDDFKVPSRPDIPFDTHCINGKLYEFAYPYIKKHLERIFTGYSIHYLIPKNVQSRAKFVAMPKSWSINLSK